MDLVGIEALVQPGGAGEVPGVDQHIADAEALDRVLEVGSAPFLVEGGLHAGAQRLPGPGGVIVGRRPGRQDTATVIRDVPRHPGDEVADDVPRHPTRAGRDRHVPPVRRHRRGPSAERRRHGPEALGDRAHGAVLAQRSRSGSAYGRRVFSAVVLVGPPGAGKSTIGAELGRLGLRWHEWEQGILDRWGSRDAFVANKDDGLRLLHAEIEALIDTPGAPVVLETTGLSDATFLDRLAAERRVLFVRCDVSRAAAGRRIAARPTGQHLSDDPV